MSESNPASQVRPRCWNGWGTAMAISGVIALFAPLFGLLGTVFGMVGAFGELEKEEMGDPEALAGGISTALFTTAGGIIISIVGFIFALVFLVLFLVTLDRDKKAAISENS